MFDITKTTQLILDGYIDKATDLYLKYRLYEDAPAIYYAEWSKIGELLGLYQLAKEDIERALSIDKSFNIDYLYQYVKLLLKLSIDTNKCIRILQKIIKTNPNYKDAKVLLIELYKKLGWSKAIEILEPLYKKDPIIRKFTRNISNSTVSIFDDLLGGRRDIYALELLDNSSAKNINVINNPLTTDLLKAHLIGEKTLYWFPISKNLTVNIIAIDYYISPNEFEPWEDQLYISELLFSSFWQGYDFLYKKDIPVVAEFISNYSARMWIFLENECHFLEARRLTKQIVQTLPITKPKVQIKPILPTKPQSSHWIEYPIAIPLGIDLYTGKRRYFLERKTKKPIEDQIKFIEQIQQINSKYLKQKINKSEKVNPQHLNVNKELQHLINSCNVISYLIRKIENGKILSREEKIVIFYTIGLLDPSRQLLHKVLISCPDYKYKNIQRQAKNLYPRPISCLKIRELLPNITNAISCNCIFDRKSLDCGRYPTPILHVDPRLVPTKDERYTAKFCKAKELAEQYLSINQEIKALMSYKDELKKQLSLALYKENKNRIRIHNNILVYNGKKIKIIKV